MDTYQRTRSHENDRPVSYWTTSVCKWKLPWLYKKGGGGEIPALREFDVRKEGRLKLFSNIWFSYEGNYSSGRTVNHIHPSCNMKWYGLAMLRLSFDAGHSELTLKEEQFWTETAILYTPNLKLFGWGLATLEMLDKSQWRSQTASLWSPWKQLIS